LTAIRYNSFSRQIRHIFFSQNLENDPRYIERKDIQADTMD